MLGCCVLIGACSGGDDDGAEATTTTEATEAATTTVAESTTTIATTTTTTEPPLVTDGATVVVANASIVGGSAGRMTDELASNGFTTSDPVNATVDVEDSIVHYVVGDDAAQAVAESLAQALGGVDVSVLPEEPPTESGDLDGEVLLLLGNNQADRTLDELSNAVSIETEGSVVVVANTSGVSGSAGRMAAQLDRAGFEVGEATNGNSSSGIVNSRDKLRSLQILSRHQIGIPRTTFVRDKRDVLPAIERVGGAPVIIKLLEGTQGIGVLLAETIKSAEAIVELLQSQNQNVLIQKFVAESKGRDIRAFVVGDQVIAAMRRVAQGQEFRSNVHRGGTHGIHRIG